VIGHMTSRKILPRTPAGPLLVINDVKAPFTCDGLGDLYTGPKCEVVNQCVVQLLCCQSLTASWELSPVIFELSVECTGAGLIRLSLTAASWMLHELTNVVLRAIANAIGKCWNHIYGQRPQLCVQSTPEAWTH